MLMTCVCKNATSFIRRLEAGIDCWCMQQCLWGLDSKTLSCKGEPGTFVKIDRTSKQEWLAAHIVVAPELLKVCN